jgi:hypothetical protein
VPLVEATVTLWEKHKRYSETDIFKVIDFLIDVKHFVVFGGHIFQQTVNMPIGIVKHHFLSILFIFSKHGK